MGKKGRGGFPSFGGRGGGGAPNMQKIMKQAQQMQTKMAEAQKEVAEKTIETTSGGGMVTVLMNGQQEILSLTIKPEVLEENDPEILQDLLITAINDATEKTKKMAEEAMGSLTGGMGLPF